MDKIKDLALQYATTYKDCFHTESTDTWISRFGSCRWHNTIAEFELTEEERNNEELKELFVKEFLKHTKENMSKMNIVVTEEGKVVRQIKRKKG